MTRYANLNEQPIVSSMNKMTHSLRCERHACLHRSSHQSFVSKVTGRILLATQGSSPLFYSWLKIHDFIMNIWYDLLSLQLQNVDPLKMIGWCCHSNLVLHWWSVNTINLNAIISVLHFQIKNILCETKSTKCVFIPRSVTLKITTTTDDSVMFILNLHAAFLL